MKKMLAVFMVLSLMLSGCSVPSTVSRVIISETPMPAQTETLAPTPALTPEPATAEPTPTPIPTVDPAVAVSQLKLTQYISHVHFDQWSVVIENLTDQAIDRIDFNIDAQILDESIQPTTQVVWKNIDAEPYDSKSFLLYDDTVENINILNMTVYYHDGSQAYIPQELVGKLSPVTSVKTPIIIQSVSVSRPNSVGGVNWTVKFKNVSGYTLKYVEFDVDMINAVGDPVSDDITGDDDITVKFTGPLADGKTVAKTFRDVFYNDDTKYARLTWVDVEYTDDSGSETIESEVIPLLKIKGNY